MTSRDQINAYRTRRPDSQLSDDMIAWELDSEPDCIAEVPVEFKRELERLAEEDDDRPSPRFLVTTRAPLSLYDFASAPHGGKWKPIPDHGGEPAISPRIHIHHSIVGSGAGAWGYFANSTSLESTNIVLKSGYLWQIMSRREQADANLYANDFAISTETEDNGNPDTDPLTPEQIDTWAWVAFQDIKEFGIPRRICPAWDAGGVGYHSMFGAPSNWTPSKGKTCPGTIRIRQWREIVIPRILGNLQEDDMYDADAEDRLKTWLDAKLDLYSRKSARFTDHGDDEVPGASNHNLAIREENRLRWEALGKRLDAIEETVERLDPTPTATSTPMSTEPPA